MKVISYLAVILLFVGCKATKEIKTQKSDSSVVIKNDILQSSSVKNDKTTVVANVNETVTGVTATAVEQSTEWSVPDSTGKQFPVKTITRYESSNIDSKHKATNVAVLMQKSDSSGTAIDKTKIKASVTTQAKEKKVIKPINIVVWLCWILVFIAIVSAGELVYRYYFKK